MPLALAMLVDALVGHPVSAVIGTLSMLAAMALLTIVGVRGARRARRLGRGWIALVLPAIFLLARADIAIRQLGEAPSDDLVAAAATYELAFLLLASTGWLALAPPRRLVRLVARMLARPSLLLAGSFGAIIVVGTLLLMLPLSVRRVSDVSFVDSLFTITSAVCVTGLTVNEPGATYTFFGQLVILAAIQLGGIGIMTIAAVVPLVSRDASLSAQSRYASVLDAGSLGDLRALVARILVGTFAIEAIGALLLWLRMGHDETIGYPIWFAVFHAVSAFCNAGITLFRGNLARFVGDPIVQIVVMLLIVLGGIGFPVIAETWDRAWRRLLRRLGREVELPPRRRLASRVALWTTLVLIVVGALAIGLLEAGRGFAGLGFGKGLLASVFASVTTRTAGFSTVDFGTFREATLLLVMVLMFIGGSPGSTAGGIKTTTFAVILASLRAELRGGDPHLFRRRVPEPVMRKAIAVTASAVTIVVVTIFLLSLTEDHPFVKVAFEAVSAFGTVGLSMGITASLTTFGKLVIVAAMFLGRVGPLTIAFAVAQSVARHRYRHAPEDMPIG